MRQRYHDHKPLFGLSDEWDMVLRSLIGVSVLLGSVAGCNFILTQMGF